jgi:hypothetical protein
MFKTIPPNCYSYLGLDRPQEVMIKVSTGRNLIGPVDFKDFIKVSSESTAHLFRNWLKMAKETGEWQTGEVPTHQIAMGCSERYNANRNGDAFSRYWLKQNHPTFVKHAKNYRNHKADNPDINYGKIALSNYNTKMDYVELLSLLNSTKQAAERNKGLVADLELERLSKGESFPISMSCFVDYDICSHCKNKAESRSQYCGDKEFTTKNRDGTIRKVAACVVPGGVKANLGRILEDGSTVSVDNFNPIFIDISHLTNQRRADRIAQNAGILEKISNVDNNYFPGGAELAEKIGHSAPVDLELSTSTTNMEAQRQALLMKTLIALNQGAKFDRPIEYVVAGANPEASVLGDDSEDEDYSSEEFQKRRDEKNNKIKNQLLSISDINDPRLFAASLRMRSIMPLEAMASRLQQSDLSRGRVKKFSCGDLARYINNLYENKDPQVLSMAAALLKSSEAPDRDMMELYRGYPLIFSLEEDYQNQRRTKNLIKMSADRFFVSENRQGNKLVSYNESIGMELKKYAALKLALVAKLDPDNTNKIMQCVVAQNYYLSNKE